MANAEKKKLDFYLQSTEYSHSIHFHMRTFHGFEGESISYALIRTLFGGPNGYYMKYDERFVKLFSTRNNYSAKKVKLVIDDAITENFFSKEKFEEFSILTSKEIQHNWAIVVRERMSQEFIPEHLFPGIADVLKKKIKS